jgi:hypothetical protein
MCITEIVKFIGFLQKWISIKTEKKNAQFTESETGAWNGKHEMNQRAINRISHMTSANLYFIFNAHNPYMGESKMFRRQTKSRNNVHI